MRWRLSLGFDHRSPPAASVGSAPIYLRSQVNQLDIDGECITLKHALGRPKSHLINYLKTDY